MPAERPSIFDLCPTCLNPKPCVLHDQRFMEELLHPEEQPPEIEKTREWEYGNNIWSISLAVDFSAMKKSILVGGNGGKLHLWEVPEDKLLAYNERMSKTPEVPPMPEY